MLELQLLKNKITGLLLIMAFLGFTNIQVNAQKIGKVFKREGIKVDVHRISLQQKKDARLSTFTAEDNYRKADKKKAKTSTAYADDIGYKKNKRKKSPDKTLQIKENRTYLSQKTRSALQSTDFLHSKMKFRDKLTPKERKDFEKDSSFIEPKISMGETKKNKKSFNKGNKLVVKRNIKLQDPATRKRMKKHKRETKKTK